MKQHTEDYKLNAVRYYLNHQDLRETCKIFNCKYQSLSRWVKTYKHSKSVKRKTRKNRNIKITPKIEKFVKDYVKKYPTTTLWEYSKLIKENYNVELSDKSIYNILHKHKITRKRVRSKYYPEKKGRTRKTRFRDFL